MSKDAVVGNAADKEQVDKANENERVSRETELQDLVDVLTLPGGAGRRVLWRIIGWSGCEGTPARHNDALTYMAIGSGDVGRWLKAEIVEAGDELLFQMMRENSEKQEDDHGKRNARRISDTRTAGGRGTKDA